MTAHRIEIAATGECFTCPEDASLLHALRRLGRKGIPAGCYGGGCGVCKVRVLAGPYSTGKMSRDQVSEAEQRAGYALACKTFPGGDLRVQVIGKMRRALGDGPAAD